jgi:mannitol/fructose-specific phosphotransferase system IIA component (Ntr-type)
LLRDPRLRQALLAAQKPEQVLELIREAEEKL